MKKTENLSHSKWEGECREDYAQDYAQDYEDVDVNRKLLVFSSILFLFISLTASASYTFSARQINRAHVQQQLAIAGETIKMRLAAEVGGEVPLVLKLGHSPIIREFFVNPDDPFLKAYALAEFDLFQRHSSQGAVFWVNGIDNMLHTVGADPYFIDPDAPENYWYNLTMYETEDYNLNINYNSDSDMINLRINVPVFAYMDDGSRKSLGALGTDINLTGITQIINSTVREHGNDIAVYLFNRFHEITGAANPDLIINKVHLADHLGRAGEEVISISDSVEGGIGRNYIFGDYMYRVDAVPAIRGWKLALICPIPGLPALNRSVNVLFFDMLFLILFLFIIINIVVFYSKG